MDRIKKLDNELIEAKREQSPIPSPKLDEILAESKIHRSYMRNLTHSRSKNIDNGSVV